MPDNTIKKIDQLTVIDPSTNESASYDIDLPKDATPEIASLTVIGSNGIKSTKFVYKNGNTTGTSSQFLKADGSLDNTDYNNQNAFSSIVAGQTTIAAGNATDTVTINGSNVNITGNASSNVITVGIDSTSIANALGYTPADNSAVVHKTGNLPETVTGQKTFTSIPIIQASDGSSGQKMMAISYNQIQSYGTTTGGSTKLVFPNPASGSTTYTLNLPAANGTIATTDDLSGFVTGPNSSTDNNIALFDGTTGKAIKSDDKISYYHADGTLVSAETSINLSRSFTHNLRQVTETARYKTDGIEVINKAGSIITTAYKYGFPAKNGTLALTEDIKSGILTINKNGIEAGTFSANQNSDIDIDIDTIEKVASQADIPNNELGLYRYTEEVDIGEQSSHIIEVIQKDYDASEVLFEKTTETNNTSLTTTTFFDHFANTLPGWLSLSAASSIYALYYNLPFNGIRFGAGSSAGTLTFTLSADCDLTFYKYFSYNGSTHEVISYDAAAAVIVDGVSNSFVDDTTPIVVHLTAGTHTISSYYISDPKTTGRIILTSFEFEGDPYTAYEQKELARVEEVDAVDTKLEQHKTESHNRFVADEQAIDVNRQGIVDINSRMGDIQLFQSQYANLPNASAEYKDKIYRDKNSNALFQCVSSGDGVAKDWDFANVAGTSEITSSNVDSFYGNAGGNFDDFFEVNYSNTTTKFYRNNGSLKLGSSSAIGVLSLDVASSLGLTGLKIGVKAYNTNGSTVYFETDDGSETHFISNNDTETLFDLTSIAVGTSYVYIASQASHEEGEEGSEITVNNDKRLIITRIIADFGTITYSWVPAAMPMIEFTSTLKIKNIPQGGAYLFWPEAEGSGTLVYKYYDSDNNYTELYFQNPDGYNYYDGTNVENTLVQTALDSSSWHGYAIDSNVIHKTGTETITGIKCFQDTELRFGPNGGLPDASYWAVKFDSSFNLRLGDATSNSGLGSLYIGGKFNSSNIPQSGYSYIKVDPVIHAQSTPSIIFSETVANSNNSQLSAKYTLPTLTKGNASGTAPTYTIATTEEITKIKRYI